MMLAMLSRVRGGASVGGGDVTSPTLSSATINSAGTSLTLAFSETVTFGAGGNTGWTVSLSGGAATVSYASGSGSSSLVYTISRTGNSGETGTVSYTNPGNGVEDTAGNDLGTVSAASITNNSSQGGGGDGINITGTAMTITQSGGCLGTKSTAQPLVYDNFESGTPGVDIAGNAPVYRAIGGSWTWSQTTAGPDGQPPEYSSTIVRPNSTRSSHHVFGTNGWNSSLRIPYTVAQGGQVYFSFWYYFNRMSGTPESDENHKPWIYYFASAGETYDAWGDTSVDIRSHGYTTGSSYGPDQLSDHYNEWVRIEVWLSQGTLNTATSSHTTYIHKPEDSIAVQLQYAKTNVLMSDNTQGFLANLDFGSFNGVDGLVADVYIDEIYFDSTRQRVEIANNATWASRTFSEVQPATAWSDTSITCRFVQGRHTSGSTGHVFVINSSGTATYIGPKTIP